MSIYITYYTHNEPKLIVGNKIQGSTAPVPPEEEEIDEMDDIDKVRDDLQSTKQLLAMELR